MWYDEILKSEVDLMIWIQDAFEFAEPLLEVFSTYTSSSFALFQILPLLVAFDVRLYVTLLLVTLTSHYTVNILKWILADTRPYWWISETTAYGDLLRPTLRQTPHSCETTPGCPSGHTMFNAALMYVVLVELLRSSERHLSAKATRNLQFVCWNIFTIHLLLVSISRIYFGCHFLHQCVLGVILGVACTQYVLGQSGIVKWTLSAAMSKLSWVIASVVAIALTIYFGQILLGIDPLWSIRKAFKWCSDPQFVRPESTTVYLLIRDFGLFSGLVLSAPLSDKLQVPLDWKRSFPFATILILLYNFLLKCVPRLSGVAVFYATTFLLNLCLVYLLLYIIPRCCQQTVRTGTQSPGSDRTGDSGLRYEGTTEEERVSFVSS